MKTLLILTITLGLALSMPALTLGTVWVGRPGDSVRPCTVYGSGPTETVICH